MRVGNNAYDNEMLSTIEKLCEAGLIINCVCIKWISRVVNPEKNFFVSCIVRITFRIMKNKSDVKREKINSQRRRFVEKLNAPARKKFSAKACHNPET